MKKLLFIILAGYTCLFQANQNTENLDKSAPQKDGKVYVMGTWMADTKEGRHNDLAQHRSEMTRHILSECKKSATKTYWAFPFCRIYYTISNSPTFKQMLDEKHLNEVYTSQRKGGLDSNFRVKKIKRFFKDEIKNVTIKSEIHCREPKCADALEKAFSVGAKWAIQKETGNNLVDGYVDWYKFKDKFTECQEMVWKPGSYEGDIKSRSFECITKIPFDQFKKMMK